MMTPKSIHSRRPAATRTAISMTVIFVNNDHPMLLELRPTIKNGTGEIRQELELLVGEMFFRCCLCFPVIP